MKTSNNVLLVSILALGSVAVTSNAKASTISCLVIGAEYPTNTSQPALGAPDLVVQEKNGQLATGNLLGFSVSAKVEKGEFDSQLFFTTQIERNGAISTNIIMIPPTKAPLFISNLVSGEKQVTLNCQKN